MRKISSYSFPAHQVDIIKQRMLNWANRFSILLYLDSNHYPDPYGKYECLLATGNQQGNAAHSLAELQQLYNTHHDWLFGHICYDYKNQVEGKLTSSHTPNVHFPELYFFIPDVVCSIPRDTNKLHVASFSDPEEITNQILSASSNLPPKVLPEVQFTKRMQQQEYLHKTAKLREHIREGDCYEINLCVEGFADQVVVDPLTVYKALNQLSPAPFSAHYRLNELYAICASPERYLCKTGNTLAAQPIKGTISRKTDATEDELQKRLLRENIKEQAENVMITDLMRNDLARSCEVGSIKVEELFGVYTFPQVHHLISTITGEIKNNTALTEPIRLSFPMGSMTGAPKHIVMQLTEQYENSRRELFSGTIGYITPGGDFDLNVMIRSLYYNAQTQYLSYHTGGAITYDSVAEQEWEELQLKAWAMERMFKAN